MEFSDQDVTGTFAVVRNIHGRQGRATGVRRPVFNILQVLTSPITNITTTTASSGGNIVSLGTSVINTRGICWNTLPNPTISLSTKTVETGTFGVGVFTGAITGLLPGIQYFVRAYATNALAITEYGQNESFTTLTTTPTVVITSASIIVSQSATVQANITSTGGLTVTTRGIVWDTNPNPTIMLPTKIEETGTFGTGTYSATLTGLTQNSYFVRAYAVNANGISYSADSTVSVSINVNTSSIANWTTSPGGTTVSINPANTLRVPSSNSSQAQITTFLGITPSNAFTLALQAITSGNMPTNGCAALYIDTITLGGTQTLRFNWTISGGDVFAGSPWNDSAWVVMRNTVTNTSQIINIAIARTTPTTGTFAQTFAAGTYSISFACFNGGDSSVDIILQVSNVLFN